MFQPAAEYTIGPDKIQIRDFHDYRNMFVTRPPYQRKAVWNLKRQQDLMDSLLRGYYVPRLVLREVRLSKNQLVREVVDGQQRISTVQNFFANELTLPEKVKSLHPGLGGKFYQDLDDELRQYLDRLVKFDVDVIRGIDDPKSHEHQKIATEIFWRLQQGEALNEMEKAHARLSSLPGAAIPSESGFRRHSGASRVGRLFSGIFRTNPCGTFSTPCATIGCCGDCSARRRFRPQLEEPSSSGRPAGQVERHDGTDDGGRQNGRGQPRPPTDLPGHDVVAAARRRNAHVTTAATKGYGLWGGACAVF